MDTDCFWWHILVAIRTECWLCLKFVSTVQKEMVLLVLRSFLRCFDIFESFNYFCNKSAFLKILHIRLWTLQEYWMFANGANRLHILQNKMLFYPFLGHRPGTLTKTGITRERKVVELIRWSQNLRNDLGYPGFSAKKQVSIWKNGFSGRIPNFWGQKKMFTS